MRDEAAEQARLYKGGRWSCAEERTERSEGVICRAELAPLRMRDRAAEQARLYKGGRWSCAEERAERSEA